MVIRYKSLNVSVLQLMSIFNIKHYLGNTLGEAERTGIFQFRVQESKGNGRSSFCSFIQREAIRKMKLVCSHMGKVTGLVATNTGYNKDDSSFSRN